MPTPSRASSRPACSTSSPGPTTSPRPTWSPTGPTPTRPPAVAYRCSFRVTEASYFIERLVQTAAYELGVDPVELRRRNFIKPEQFPYTSATGFVYDSGNYEAAMDKALEMLGYEDLKAEQERARQEGKLLGIGLASFTEVVGAGPSKDYDILGLKMFDSAELRVHPTGKAILKIGVQTQGQGHETTFAQIVANELGIPPEDILVQHGDTDNTPYGLGTYASRSTPTAGAATAMVSRKLRDKARALAAHLLEVAPEDLEWAGDRFQVRAPPTGRRPSRRPPSPPTPTTPRAWRRGWRASPTTTRPT